MNALPANGQVVSGSAAISQSQTPTSASMTVNQTSQRAVVNWDSFNVGKNAQVTFNQPSSSAVTLNRVTGASASMIEGAVKANGQVVFVNPNGVTFGKGSEINAAGVVATTMDISNQDFMDGKSTYKGTSKGSVTNEGKITTNTEGGYIALLAPEVRNDGYVLAKKGGAVALAAGEQITLDFKGNALISVKVDIATYNALIENKRVVEAGGGLVVIAAGSANQLVAGVIKNTGRISASSMVNNGGTIELIANTVNQAGKLTANSKTAEGGQINLVGNDITMASNSKTTATGATAGGQVNVGLGSTAVSGGSQLNAQVNIPTQAQIKANADQAAQNNQLAQTVTIEENALIDTSATQTGNGGAIAIWSQVKTTVAGILKSMGGALSGNGGFIETSSKGTVNLAPTVQINTSANNATGSTGTWLLDPIDLIIDGSAAGVISSILSSSNVTIAVTNATSLCPGLGACIPGALASNLTIAANIEKTGSLYTKLTLSSSGDFHLNSGISITGQNLDVVISSSLAYLDVGSSINASKVTIQAQTEIRSYGSIQTSNYLLGSAGSLGNAIELLAQAIYVTGLISLNASTPADPPFRIVGANINAVVDSNLDKVYSTTAANDSTMLATTAAASNVIRLTASQIDPNTAAIVDLKGTAQVLANGTTGGSIYLSGTNIYTRAGSLLQANGSAGDGGVIDIKADSIAIAGEVSADGSINGGSINFVANTNTLDVHGGLIQANGMGGSGGSMNALVMATASFTADNHFGAGVSGSSFDLSNALFISEKITSAASGALSLGYEIINGSGLAVTLGTGAYANLSITGTPSYFSNGSAITNSAGSGSYSNLIIKGLTLSGIDSGHFMLVAIPVSLTVTAAQSATSVVQTVVTTSQTAGTTSQPDATVTQPVAAPAQTVTTLPPPPPPPPPPVVFSAPLPLPAPAKLELVLSLARMDAPPPVADKKPASAAMDGDLSMPSSAKTPPLVVMADGSIQLTPPAPPPSANASASQAPPPVAPPPPPGSRASSNRDGRSTREGNGNSEKRNSNTKDGVEKVDTKDQSSKSSNGPSKYVSKYANGFRSGDKSASKDKATKVALASNKPNSNRVGKYESRIKALSNNPAAVAAMNQTMIAGNISPFPPGVPHVDVTPITLRGGDSLAQSYDDVPSIRNSGVANAARSRNSENFHESLESVNLMSTLNLFIIH